MARFAPLYNVQIASAEAEVRMTIDRREKLGLGGPGAAARGVSVSLRIESPSPAADVGRLSQHARRACHAEATIAVPVPVTHETVLNGAPVGTGGTADQSP